MSMAQVLFSQVTNSQTAGGEGKQSQFLHQVTGCKRRAWTSGTPPGGQIRGSHLAAPPPPHNQTKKQAPKARTPSTMMGNSI